MGDENVTFREAKVILQRRQIQERINILRSSASISNISRSAIQIMDRREGNPIEGFAEKEFRGINNSQRYARLQEVSNMNVIKTGRDNRLVAENMKNKIGLNDMALP